MCERCGRKTELKATWFKRAGYKIINPRSYLCQKCCDQLGWDAEELLVQEIKKKMGYKCDTA